MCLAKMRCEINLQKSADVPEWKHVNISRNSVVYRVSQEECARLREGVPYAKVYRYNPKNLCPKLNGYGNNGQWSLKL